MSGARHALLPSLAFAAAPVLPPAAPRWCAD